MVDLRGPRSATVVTSVIFVAVLLTASSWLLLAQTMVFLTGAVAGLRYAPYGLLYRVAIRPWPLPPAELEDAGPPRLARSVGAVFGAVGTAGFLAGVPALGHAATGLAFVAAFLNAATGFCLGCQIYLALRSVKGVHT